MIEYLLNRGKQEDDLATTIRNELRADVKELRGEVRAEAKESQEWTDKYYRLFEEYSSLQVDYKALRHKYEKDAKRAAPDSPAVPDLKTMVENEKL